MPPCAWVTAADLPASTPYGRDDEGGIRWPTRLRAKACTEEARQAATGSGGGRAAPSGLVAAVPSMKTAGPGWDRKGKRMCAAHVRIWRWQARPPGLL